MPVSVTRQVHFNAAHRLHNAAREPAWNETTFGACNNPNFHGHNYELEVTVSGEIDPDTGFVIDLAVLKALLDEHIVAVLDHKNLNLDVPWFADHIPTAENIAVYCWDQLAPRLPVGRLTNIRLWETPRNYVDYQGPA
jgi:6-pyruvoyltetrahydropterin/6-carboxytetrahydropterin synthase